MTIGRSIREEDKGIFVPFQEIARLHDVYAVDYDRQGERPWKGRGQTCPATSLQHHPSDL